MTTRKASTAPKPAALTAAQPLDLAQFEGHTPGPDYSPPYWLAATTVSGIKVAGYAIGKGNAELGVFTDRAAAAYVARACNSFPALLAECRRLRESLSLREQIAKHDAREAHLKDACTKQAHQLIRKDEQIQALRQALVRLQDICGAPAYRQACFADALTQARAALAKVSP